MGFKFVPELRLLCLRKIALMANEYGVKSNVSDFFLNKKEANWPLTNLSPEDRICVCKDLSRDIPLKNALAYKPTNFYWLMRVIKEFPSPHVLTPWLPTKKKESVTEGAKDGTEKKKSKKEREANRERKTVKKELPLINFLPQNSDWFRSYIEITIASRLQGTSQDDIKAIQSLPLALVKSLDLRNIRSPESGASSSTRVINFPEILNCFPKLKQLNVNFKPSQSFLTPSISPSYAERFSSILTKLSLTHLSLFESCLDDESVEPLLKCLSTMLFLKFLDLRHNRLTSKSTAILKDVLEGIELQSLKLDHNLIDVKGSHDIAAIISISSTMKSLSLDLNPLKDEGSIIILESVFQHGSVRLLSMAGCNIQGSENFWNLLLKLKENTSLQYLCLASNLFERAFPEVVLELGKHTRTRLFLTSIIQPLQMLFSEKHSRMTKPFQTLRTEIQTPLEDIPALKYPSLPQEVIHGIDFDEGTFQLEREIQGASIYSKVLSEI